MHQIRKINNDLAISGQIDSTQLSQIAQDGFRSVLNLRSPEEIGFIATEQQIAETLMLEYSNLPFNIERINDQATQIFWMITKLPKPLLVHCDNGVRSAAIILMHLATQQGATLEQALEQAQQLGLFTVLTQA